MIRPELAEVVQFAKAMGLPASDGEFCYYKWMENDWTNGKRPIRDWQLTLRSWKAGNYLPSQKLASARTPVASLPVPPKKIKEPPARVEELMALVRIRFPEILPIPWFDLPHDVRSHAERQLAEQSNPQPRLI